MEKLPSCTVVSLDCGWADLGSWSALRDHQVKKPGGNALIGDASAIDCRNSLLKSTNSDMAIVGLGLDGIVAVATDDAVLVADASRSEEVGKAIEVLNARSAPQAEEFPAATAPGDFMKPCHWARGSRSNGSLYIPARSFRCKAMCTAQNTGWWSKDPRW